MPDLDERLQALARKARGRCHSCLHQRTFDEPTGTRHWCRAFDVEMTPAERDQVRNCPRWQPFRSGLSRKAGRLLRNPLLHDQIEAEDRLFWQLKSHLDEVGLDLKTVLVLVHEPLTSTAELSWVDSLDSRFADEDPGDLADILSTLRALGYTSLCQMVERVLKPRSNA